MLKKLVLLLYDDCKNIDVLLFRINHFDLLPMNAFFVSLLLLLYSIKPTYPYSLISDILESTRRNVYHVSVYKIEIILCPEFV